MAGFSFPPPPPPPPKAAPQDGGSATNQAQPGAYAQRPGRGGGERGRARGRGRGAGSRGGYGRGGATNNHASMNHSPHHGHSLPPKPQSASQPPFAAQAPAFDMSALPAGGYVNPAFASRYPNTVNGARPASQPWLSQAPSGQAPGLPLSQAYSPIGLSAGATDIPARPSSSHRPQNKQKVQPAPAVPSFGFALPTLNPHDPPREAGSKSKKRKFNQLGLTPRSDVHEDSEEDDADEEAKFSASGGILQFEYKGRSSTLKTAADVAAWIEERKKKFPTKERVAQKQKDEQEAREARRRAKEQAETERKANYPDQTKSTKKRKKDVQERRGAVEKERQKAEKLRKKLQKAEERIAKAVAASGAGGEEERSSSGGPPKRDLGLNYDSDESQAQSDDSGSGRGSSSLSDSSSEVTSDSDSGESSSDDSEDDSDSPPEEESSAKRPMRVHLPNRKAPQATPAPARARREHKPPKRVTLHERMVEQERRKEAELALQAIKLLGENGMLV